MWKKILKNHYIAFAEFYLWLQTGFKMHDDRGYELRNGDLWIATCTESYKFNNRDLLDFFDEQGIFINVENIGNIDKSHFRVVIKKTEEMQYTWINKKGVKIRPEAETDAFIEAFKIFQQKLLKK